MAGCGSRIGESLAGLRDELPVITGGVNEPVCTVEGEEYLMFCANNYLSLSEDRRIKDAAINAITEAIRKVDKVHFRLTDFNVEIPTTGSDATVEATMVLTDEFGTQVVEKGTSPDIIVASIEAYEKGYNELVYQRRNHRRQAGSH